MRKKIKVGLIVDEFFGGAGTAFGGYGFLARRYIARYIPNEDIQIDVLLGRGKKYFSAQHFREDNVDLYKLPKIGFMARRWLEKMNYDIYFSIELTTNYILKYEPNPNKKLILGFKILVHNMNGTKLIQSNCFPKRAITIRTFMIRFMIGMSKRE